MQDGGPKRGRPPGRGRSRGQSRGGPSSSSSGGRGSRGGGALASGGSRGTGRGRGRPRKIVIQSDEEEEIVDNRMDIEEEERHDPSDDDLVIRKDGGGRGLKRGRPPGRGRGHGSRGAKVSRGGASSSVGANSGRGAGRPSSSSQKSEKKPSHSKSSTTTSSISINRKEEELMLNISATLHQGKGVIVCKKCEREFEGQHEFQQHAYWCNSTRMTRRSKPTRVYLANMKIKPMEEVHVPESTNLEGRGTSDTCLPDSSLDEDEEGVPVICSKCKMTYKNTISLQKHLSTCTDASTSSDTSSTSSSSEDEDESSRLTTERVLTEETFTLSQPLSHQPTFADASIGVDLDQDDEGESSSTSEEEEEEEEEGRSEDVDNRLPLPSSLAQRQEEHKRNSNSFDENYSEANEGINGVNDCNIVSHPQAQIPLQAFVQQQTSSAPEQQQQPRTHFAWTGNTNTNSSTTSTLVTFQDPTTGQLYRLSVPIQGAQQLSSQSQTNNMTDFSQSPAAALQTQLFSQQQQQFQQPLQQHNNIFSSGLHNLGLGLTHAYGSDTSSSLDLGLYPRTTLPGTYQSNNDVHFLSLNPHSQLLGLGHGGGMSLGPQTFQSSSSLGQYQQPAVEPQQLASTPSSHSLRTLPMQIQYNYNYPQSLLQLQQDRINYAQQQQQQQQIYEALLRRQVLQPRYPVSDPSSQQQQHAFPHPLLQQQQPSHTFESPVASSSTSFLNTPYGSFQQGQSSSSHYQWQQQQQQTLIEPPKATPTSLLHSPQPIRAIPMPTSLSYAAATSTTHYLGQSGPAAASLASPNKIIAPNNSSNVFQMLGANTTQASTYLHMQSQNQATHDQYVRCSQEALDTTTKLLTGTAPSLPPNFRLSIQQPQAHSNNLQFLTLPNNAPFNDASCVKRLSNEASVPEMKAGTNFFHSTTNTIIQPQSQADALKQLNLNTQAFYDCVPQNNTQESSNSLSNSQQETVVQSASIMEANRSRSQVHAPTVWPPPPQPQQMNLNLSSSEQPHSSTTLPLPVATHELPSSSQWNLSGATGFLISSPQYLPSTPIVPPVPQPEKTKRARMSTSFPRPIEPKPTTMTSQADQLALDPTSKNIKSQLANIILEKQQQQQQQQSVSVSIPQEAQTFLRKNPVLTAVVRPMEHPLQKLSDQISQIESTFQASNRSNILLNFRPAAEGLPNPGIPIPNAIASGSTNVLLSISNSQPAPASNADISSVRFTTTTPQTNHLPLVRSEESNERKNHNSGSSSSDVGRVASPIRFNLQKTHAGDCLVKGLSGIGENKNPIMEAVNMNLKTENGGRKHIVITPKIHMIPIPEPRDDETDCNLTISEDSSGSSSPSSLEGSTSGLPSQAHRLVRVAVVYEVSHENSIIFQSNDVRLIWSYVWQEENHCLPPLSYPETTISLEDKEGPSTTFSLKTLVHRAVQFFLQHVGTRHRPQIPVSQQSSAEGSENSTGCCRTEGYQVERKPFDIFGWLENKFRKPPPLPPVTGDDVRTSGLPMSMRYRLYKSRPKNLLTVMWSTIHGKGLYTRRDIEKGDIVVEYCGEVIRSLVCEQREKYYQARNIGCYMFRINDEFVVDATLKGNAARFINHSCDPNCESRTVRIGNTELILICALRRIVSGEELTYDYKFTVEDEQYKIKCGCGAKKCKRYLN